MTTRTRAVYSLKSDFCCSWASEINQELIKGDETDGDFASCGKDLANTRSRGPPGYIFEAETSSLSRVLYDLVFLIFALHL
jgi:hypothetical protein